MISFMRQKTRGANAVDFMINCALHRAILEIEVAMERPDFSHEMCMGAKEAIAVIKKGIEARNGEVVDA